MRYTNYLLVDSPHWRHPKKHKDHRIAIAYFNRYNLPDNAIICWQKYLSMLCIHYHGCILDKEEKVSKSDYPKNTEIMLWKKFKKLIKKPLQANHSG